MSCVLGFDVGSQLIGVAVGHALTGSARGIAVITVRQGVADWSHLDRLREEWQPRTLIVGLPLMLDGGEQPASRHARRFAAAMRERYAVAVDFIDERYSSQEAAERFADARAEGLRRRRDAAHIDADAAAVILERWLLERGSASPAAS